jgi:hypothetical protein
MEIRRAAPEDYPGILELQSANYLENLAAEEREGGFLSAEFTLSQIATMAEDLGIVVASDGNRIVGYLCAHRADVAPLPPVVEAMLRCCRTATYRGQALADARLFVYGPVCLSRSHRGRGVLRDHFDALVAHVAGRFEYAVTLVADNNPHSLRAHMAGLGMDNIAQFDHGGQSYHLLAFGVP